MKIIPLLLISIASTNAFSQQQFEVNIKRVMDLKPQYNCQYHWTYVYDSIITDNQSSNDKVLEFIVANNQRVAKREVAAWFELEMKLPLDSEEINGYQFRLDTILDKDKKSGSILAKPVRIDADYGKSSHFRLSEEWYYDTKTKKIQTIVNGFCPVFSVYSEEQVFKGLQPRYWIKQKTPLTYKTAQSSMLKDSNIIWAQGVTTQISLRYASTKQVLDANKGTVYFAELKKIHGMDLSQILFEEACSDKLNVYNINTGEKLDSLQINEVVIIKDTIVDFNIYGEIFIKPIQHKVDISELGPMIIKQSCIFDAKNHTVSSKIESIVITRINWETHLPKELFEIRF